MPTVEEATRLLAHRVRAGERVAFADGVRAAALFRDDAGFHLDVPHWRGSHKDHYAGDPGAMLEMTINTLLRTGFRVEGVELSWPPLPIDAWIDRLEHGDRLEIAYGRAGALEIARTAGWYQVKDSATNWVGPANAATLQHLRDRLAEIPPSDDPRVNWRVDPDALIDVFTCDTHELCFYDGTLSLGWTATIRRLPGGRFLVAEVMSDHHDPRGGWDHENIRELDEAEARAQAEAWAFEHFPWNRRI